jgi:hypothetical protein
MTSVQILEVINRLSPIEKQEVIKNLQSNSIKSKTYLRRSSIVRTSYFTKVRPRILGPTGGTVTKCPYCGK